MRWLSLVLCGLIWSPAAPASLPPYRSLYQSPAVLNLTLARLAERQGWTTLLDVRRHLGLALIYGTHPLNRGFARQLRRKIGEWDMPDQSAVLTRDELDYAERLYLMKLNDRARIFLKTHRVRTAGQLRDLDLETLGNDLAGKKAHQGLVRLGRTCVDLITET